MRLAAQLRYCGNLDRWIGTVKQKAQASADFLGVLTIPRKVVSLCVFWTT
jgi:hypothetical protein